MPLNIVIANRPSPYETMSSQTTHVVGTLHNVHRGVLRQDLIVKLGNTSQRTMPALLITMSIRPEHVEGMRHQRLRARFARHIVPVGDSDPAPTVGTDLRDHRGGDGSGAHAAGAVDRSPPSR